MFYNTINLSPELLIEAILAAKQQEKAILKIYQRSGNPLTPSRVYKMTVIAGKDWPLTSIRRCITDLTGKNELVMLPSMTRGMYNKPEHYWQIKAKTTQPALQTSLFVFI